MKIDDIRALAKIMKETGLTSLKIDEDGVVIELSRAAAPAAVPVIAAAPVPMEAAKKSRTRPRTTTS